MKNKTKRLTTLAILTVLTVVLQLIPIKFGAFEFALFLIPVIVGAVVLGPLAGGFLGAISAIPIIFNSGTAVFLQFNPFYTVLIIVLKGGFAGLIAGLVFKGLRKLNRYVAIISASIIAPIVNSAVFYFGAYTLFKPLMSSAGNWFWAFVGGMMGLHFVIDLTINIVLGGTIANIILISEQDRS